MYVESSAPCKALVQECSLDWAGLNGSLIGKFFGWMFVNGSETDQAGAKGGLMDVLGELETHLEGRSLICGEDLSEADTLWAPMLGLVSVMLNEYKGYDLPGRYPNLGGYLARVHARPLYRRCLGPDFVEVAVNAFDTHPKFAGKFTRPRITLCIGAGKKRNGELHANCSFSMYLRWLSPIFFSTLSLMD